MKLATQIFLGFLIAVTVDLADSFLNYTLTLRVKRISDFLNRSQSVIRHSAALNKDMLEMQSAFRGFLLTGDGQFLAQYEQETKAIPARATQLRAMTLLPAQVSLLDSIALLNRRWMDYANERIEARKKMDPRMKQDIGQEYNRRIAELFRRFNETEYGRRDLRRRELADAILRTDRYSLMFSIFLVVISLGIALFLVRKISRRIGPLVRMAERISQGDFGQVADDRRDELTSLAVSLNRMSEKLSSTIGELEKRNAELNEFAYVVSHDLKAPVRGISNVVRWIEEDHAAELSPTIRKYLDFIPDRISRIEGLIDGLLEYARAGRTGAVKEAVDVGLLVNDLVDLIVPEGYRVRTDRLPVVFTHRLPLQQVLSNLIGNAVKYGPAGTTVIGVSGVDCGTHYEFMVEDNGPGIDPEYHEKIFGLFQTLREKTDKESTGLGLSIVRKIVEERGGSIRLISSLGNGAKFIFTWPKES
jgi:signal transduction histidine kinase